jgi:hypothetical protein
LARASFIHLSFSSSSGSSSGSDVTGKTRLAGFGFGRVPARAGLAVAVAGLLFVVVDLTTVFLTVGLAVVLTGGFAAGLAFLTTGCFPGTGLRAGFTGISEQVDVVFIGLIDLAAASLVAGLGNVVFEVNWLLAGLLAGLVTGIAANVAGFLMEVLTGVDEGLVIELTGANNLLACFGFGEIILLLGLVALAAFGLLMVRFSADNFDGRDTSFLDEWVMI